MTTPFRLGIAGLGTVGIGVVRMVQAHGEMLAAKAGRPVEISAVSARSQKDRGADLSGFAWEDDATALAARDDVDCVGGDQHTKDDRQPQPHTCDAAHLTVIIRAGCAGNQRHNANRKARPYDEYCEVERPGQRYTSQ